MSKSHGKPLRFAALIRVSTEKQERQGESLRTQDTQLTNAVATRGGKITKRYAGQEHATTGWERKQLDKLLADAAQPHKQFDAVIVADPSRWSRDNTASEAGLQTLRDNGVRFFVLATEYDLFDPHALLFLALNTSIGAFQAREQKRKSLLNRSERAKRGLPTAGRLPFGRTFDPKSGKWEIIKEKQQMMAEVAKRYLAGESLADLAVEYDVKHCNLHKTLTQRCGTTWKQEFNADDLNIHEVVEITIPPLLPEQTIDAVLKKVAANKTYQHGRPKHKYLLAGMVFCGQCGYAMTGQTNHNGHSYYRHRSRNGGIECKCRPRPWVRAHELENRVIDHLFECFGNPLAIEQAVDAAIPNREKIQELRERCDRLKSELRKVQLGRQGILRLVALGKVTEANAADQLDEINARETRNRNDLDHLSVALENLPSKDAIKSMANDIAKQFQRYGKKSRVKQKSASKQRQYSNSRLVLAKMRALDLDAMTWGEKKALVERTFVGITVDGKPMGVYIEAIPGQTEHRRKKWRFRLRGNLIDSDQCVTHFASHSPGTGPPGFR